jgi:hypothetical protein
MHSLETQKCETEWSYKRESVDLLDEEHALQKAL